MVSESPKRQKRNIEFWREKNKSNTYSKKLDLRFREVINIIKDFPQIGKHTDDSNARVKIVKDYLLIYEVTENEIIILTIWDSRQDPEKLKKIVG